ncbi:hypothetical protein ANCDUO_01063 [Ancylostoma duodenale]|uniref:Uncharacterized protein n=1 Tax=Ancylostoma duodenale TaxID=51022 RepID=A0A0C2DZV8_9BILA|nr:hypothetical protein ANCDUO_01063 [Ancylostoma duodenale]
MTGQVWKRQMDGAWQGDAVDMRYLQGFKGRLEEVRSLKQLGPQIALLLNERGVEAEVEKTIEAAMKNTAVLAYNPFTEHNWRSRVLLSGKIVEKERETDNRINNYTEQGRFLTEIAAKVVWIRQQTNKVNPEKLTN